MIITPNITEGNIQMVDMELISANHVAIINEKIAMI